jgi:NADPH-dependent glutamate synthase beta subunit-like oxidoreductase
VPEFFKEQEKIEAVVGWDGIILRSENVDLLHLCKVYLEALHRQSKPCGKCNYCTTGFEEMLDVLKDVRSGEATEEDLEFLQSSAEAVMDSSKCTIGKAGPLPVLHALKYFREWFSGSVSDQENPEGLSYYSHVTAPCVDACPIHLDIPRYIELIKDAKFSESLDVIRERLPLAGVVGRVCYHPCESHCRRANVDEPIAIRLLKRFVADQEFSQGGKPKFEITPSPKTGKVAIIGAGPAGITCAYHLGLRGHQVTLFEKQPVAGGMMTLGIPPYRLPKEIVNLEMEAVKELGVQIKSGVDIGKDVTVDQLRKEGFQGIFLSIGAHECKTLGMEGEELEGVYPGVDFLRDVNLGKEVHVGKRVAVIGGGNVAMDAVRTSIRLGAEEAFILYRRGLEEMPAHGEETRDAEREGTQINTLTVPKRIIGENGKVKEIECLKVDLGDPDESGRRRPVPIEGSEMTMAVDTVIPALGQESDWACLSPECACTVSDWGTLHVDPLTLQSADPDIFSGGDAVSGPKSLIEAAAAGLKAARSLDRYINGVPLGGTEEDHFDRFLESLRVYDPSEEIKIKDRLERRQVTKLEPEKRKNTFEEVEQGFQSPDAVAEAERCLRCYRVVTIAVQGR